ncbi:MAG: GspL/Epsl periplasmic domain-containing protein [Pirellulales bacterium]
MSELTSKDAKAELLFGPDSKSSIVILPSEHCYVAPLPANAKRLSDAELRFELESHVLIDAESMVHSVQAQDSTIAIVADGSIITEYIPESQLKTAIAICPKACLVVDGFLTRSMQGRKRDQWPLHGFVICSNNNADLLIVENNKLVHWRFCKADQAIDLLSQWVAEKTSDEIKSLVVTMIGSATQSAVVEELASDAEELKESKLSQVAVEVSSWSSEELLREAGHGVLDGKHLPMVGLQGPILGFVDLRRPAAKYAVAWIASLFLAGICVIAGMYFRALSYQAQTERLVAQQEKLFKKVFPKQKIPVGMMGRFQSEHRRLRLTKGTESRPLVPNALEVFQAFLGSLPDVPSGCRFQIQSVRFEQQTMSALSARVATAEGLDQFRQSLSRGGFKPPPISSRPDAQGVPVQWSGTPWVEPKANITTTQNASGQIDQSIGEVSQ